MVLKVEETGYLCRCARTTRAWQGVWAFCDSLKFYDVVDVWRDEDNFEPLKINAS